MPASSRLRAGNEPPLGDPQMRLRHVNVGRGFGAWGHGIYFELLFVLASSATLPEARRDAPGRARHCEQFELKPETCLQDRGSASSVLNILRSAPKSCT